MTDPSSRPGRAAPAVSWQARLLALVATSTVRPLLEVVPDSAPAIHLLRRALHAATDLSFRPHPAVTITPVSATAPDDVQVRGEWVHTGPAPHGVPDFAGGVVLYVHGSGYAVASARTHRAITSRLAVRTGRPVFACNYRLAPSHRFPAAEDDVRAAFEWLVSRGVDPDRIVLAGDSAGGQLSLSLCAGRIAAGRSPGAGLVLFSPLVDVSLARARRWERDRRRDPLVSVRRARRMLALYLDGADLAAAHLPLTSAALEGLPPLQIHVSSAEFLSADAPHLVDLVLAAGGEAELWEWPGQLHVFQVLAGLVPEATRSLGEAAGFIRRCLDRPGPSPANDPSPTPAQNGASR